MRIGVDLEKCQGHTLCAIAAAEVFDLDDHDGHAIVKHANGLIPSELEQAAARAMMTCPEQAIHELP
ncbi:ferredoxin [Mycobacterium paraseoulense]|jgi:ferredoxin|uniref:Ferredoxin n=1 Tax=Mycobacterium paraseoulense TaxID=590652 RepID=A0A1X0IGK0_9MYCO|nr:ferredoxin [Mycobacterium paraseoulense]MCV7393783.1 ferredoxin [Mycobacterium paraseoulense]ORB45479.1 hypothetical protein BST39_04515 [Mycobacterium paraseoulense]BBZ70601.1 ferredoxin [Mycobacterium paraseoulense]